MRTISKEELEQILENHRYWYRHCFKDEANMLDFMRADLSEMDLRGADLRGADLRCAILDGVILSEANLRGADLHGASLVKAHLEKANLNQANLCEANLYGADLSDALLNIETILSRANLHEAVLPNPVYMNAICPMTCPEEGAFIGWKNADIILPKDDYGFVSRVEVIVKLQIPGRAKRLSATSRKCRCDGALVLDIQSLGGESLPKGTVVYSRYDPTFTYEVGKKLHVDDFDDDRWNECSTGIHFFITRQEAVDY